MSGNGTVLEVPRHDVEPYSEIPEFLDFLRYSRHTAISDYKNAFCSLLLFCRDLQDPLSRSMLRSFQKTWVPAVADYFVIKAISRGVSMDPEAIATWKAFSESEREEYRKTLYFRHLRDFPSNVLCLIPSIDTKADKITSLLWDLEIPENSIDPIGIDSLESIETIFHLADDIVAILKAMSASLVAESAVP